MIPGNTQHIQEKCAGQRTLYFTDYLERTPPNPADYTLIAKRDKWNQLFLLKK